MLDDRVPGTVRAIDSVGMRRESLRHPVLADEVAVDFPSMRPIVEGMLAAFRAEEPAADDPVTRHARLELTARQALEGVRLPLDLTVRHICPACGGRGELQSGPCTLCGGSGTSLFEHRLHLPVPPGVHDGACLRYALAPPGADRTHVEVRIAVQ